MLTIAPPSPGRLPSVFADGTRTAGVGYLNDSPHPLRTWEPTPGLYADAPTPRLEPAAAGAIPEWPPARR